MSSKNADEVRIVPYTPDRRDLFARLWVPWLESMTGKPPEPEDLLAVSDPEQFYLRPGGAVFFAFAGDEPVGVVAVKRLSATTHEFCKLVVLDIARGQGVGRRLVEACLQFAEASGATLMMLQSFRRLEVALAMYERMGFASIPPPAEMLVLARTEVIMGMTLPRKGWLRVGVTAP